MCASRLTMGQLRSESALSTSVDNLPGILVNMGRGDESPLAANLRKLRLQCGLSTVELARHAAISRATLTQIEAGDGNPTLDTLLRPSKRTQCAARTSTTAGSRTTPSAAPTC
ncbi:MAG: hypothetical protein DLM57_03290 [Pseudonocardiales bacterium]|nr:MAG: hypothetical protein DLM57_03290 [Pseudonocardiales bacterium]